MPDIFAKYKEAMPELFLGNVVASRKLSAHAQQRQQAALWYVWGRQDAGDDRTRGTTPHIGHYMGDDFAFAEYAALQAEEFERQKVCMLHCVQAQYHEFVKLLEEGQEGPNGT